MLISVVTIVYNDKNHIEQTIKSVIRQTAFDCIEYIIIDGASTDGTVDVINKYRNRITRIISEPDSGIYNAMNKGLEAASGDYIIYMNSGDRFTSDETIELVMTELGEAKPDIFYGAYREFHSNEVSQIIPCRSPSFIWYGMVGSHQSTFYKLSFLKDQCLSYDETYKIAADYKFTAEVLKNSSNVRRLNICISDFDNNGVSCCNQDIGLREANRVRLEVFEWSKIRIQLLNIVLLVARFTKKHGGYLYKYLRKAI